MFTRGMFTVGRLCANAVEHNKTCGGKGLFRSVRSTSV